MGFLIQICNYPASDLFFRALSASVFFAVLRQKGCLPPRYPTRVYDECMIVQDRSRNSGRRCEVIAHTEACGQDAAVHPTKIGTADLATVQQKMRTFLVRVIRKPRLCSLPQLSHDRPERDRGSPFLAVLTYHEGRKMGS